MDLQFHTEVGSFNCRVVGICPKEGKFLLCRLKTDSYWALIGGKVAFGETTEEAVLREFYEETGAELEIGRLLTVTENFFEAEGRRWHQYLFCYLLRDPMDQLELFEGEREALDDANCLYRWFDSLEGVDLRPVTDRETLQALPERLEHRVCLPERPYYAAYDDRYRQIHRCGDCWHETEPTPLVGQLAQVGQRILELGCGEGRDAAPLLERGCDVLATDLSPEVIRFCKERYPQFAERFSVLDCVNGSLDGDFDFIYAVAVLHMLVRDCDRDGFYRFIRAHLTPNGRALICTMGDGESEWQTDPNEAFALREREHHGKTVQVAATSYRRIDFTTLEKELRRNGLRIEETGLTTAAGYDTLMYAIVRRE